MLEEISLLIRLQRIDDQLTEIDAEKGDLPEQIEHLQREISQNLKELDAAEQSLKAIQEDRTNQMRLIEEARERLKRSQSVLYSVKTTREYDAISSEIEQAKSQLAIAEKKKLDLKTNEERVLVSREERNIKLAQIEKESSERQHEMKDRMESSQEQELKLRHERDKLVSRLKKPVLAHYERVRKIRDGVGVSRLENGACGYCFSLVPPQRQVEIKRCDDMFLCEVCGCYIVSDDK